MSDLNDLVLWLTVGQGTIAVLLSIRAVTVARARLAQVPLQRRGRAFSRQEELSEIGQKT